MSKLLEKAIAEISKLPEQEQDEVAAWILKKLTSNEEAPDEEWETDILIETLGDVLSPNGKIDFDKLRATGLTMSLDELFPEGDSGDGE
jgi:hypothetical protein